MKTLLKDAPDHLIITTGEYYVFGCRYVEQISAKEAKRLIKSWCPPSVFNTENQTIEDAVNFINTYIYPKDR